MEIVNPNSAPQHWGSYDAVSHEYEALSQDPTLTRTDGGPRRQHSTALVTRDTYSEPTYSEPTREYVEQPRQLTREYADPQPEAYAQPSSSTVTSYVEQPRQELTREHADPAQEFYSQPAAQDQTTFELPTADDLPLPDYIPEELPPVPDGGAVAQCLTHGGHFDPVTGQCIMPGPTAPPGPVVAERKMPSWVMPVGIAAGVLGIAGVVFYLAQKKRGKKG